jgi:hypothetical protein
MMLGFRVFLVLYVTLVVLSRAGSPLAYYDEAITLVQGRMVAQGHTPYVDFWSFYPPLTYYLNAAAFAVFGRTVLAQRLLQAAFYVLVLGFSNRFLRSQFPGSRLIVSCTTILVAVAIGPKFLLPLWIGSSISLLALLTYFSSYVPPATQLRQRVAFAGALTGLAVLSRINFGGYVAATIFLDLLLIRPLSRDRDAFGHYPKLRPWQTPAIFVIAMSLSCAGIFLILCGPNFALAFRQSVLYQQHAIELRFIPLPFTTGLIYALAFPCAWFCFRMLVGADEITKKTFTPLIFAFGVLALAWVRDANRSVAWEIVLAEVACVLFLHVFICRLDHAELGLIFFFSFLLHYYLIRADDAHWPLLLPVAALLVPYLFVSPSGVQHRSSLRQISSGSVILLFGLLICTLWSVAGLRPSGVMKGVNLIFAGDLHRRVSDSDRLLGEVPPPKAWAAIYPDSNELNALRFVRARTSNTDPVFIGIDNHSEPFAVDTGAYWLLDRRIAVSFYIFDTYLTKQAETQRAMIADFQRNDVRWVILEHEPVMDDGFRQTKHPGSKLLDQFLANNFSELCRFGRYGVLAKHPLDR